MKLALSAEHQAFAQEVQAFVRERLPSPIRTQVQRGLRLDKADYVAWFNILQARGWLTPNWPVAFGGPGWDPLRRHLFDEACLLGGAPRVIASGIQMLGPVLIARGTPAQQARYLPDIRASRTWWAQGFSEPGAGSDLAALRTRGELSADGRHLVITGHKVWTSYAQWCSMMFALVRTLPQAAKPQEGISFVLFDLASPGVTVKPIRMLDGGTDLNEVFLDGVQVPIDQVVGGLHQGWDVAKALLGHERTGIAGIGSCKQQLARARALAAQQRLGGDALLNARLVQHEVELLALEATALRWLGSGTGGGARDGSTGQPSAWPQVQANMLKLRGTELRQAIHETLMDIGGPQALPLDEQALHLGGDAALPVPQELATLTANALDARKLSLYGGSNEVQRNLVARAVLSGR